MASRSHTIPESLHGELVDLYGELDPVTKKRRGYRELSTWLREVKGVDAGREAVRGVVAPLLEERAAIRRDALRDKLNEKLPSQVEALDKMLDRMKRDVERAKTTKARARAFNAFRSGVDMKLRATGVAERADLTAHVEGDLNVTVTDARTQLAQSLARLAPSVDAPAANDTAGEPHAGRG